MTRFSTDAGLVTSRRSATAAAVGAGLIVMIALVLYLPLVGFLAGATASTAGLIPFPTLSVGLVTVFGAVVVLGLLALAATRRRSGVAWVLVVVAILAALGVTAFPLVAVVLGSAQRVGEIGPVVSSLWQQVSGLF
ncbi:MFS transporter permease [Microbacterium testaceum]|uniref:MFS transporter permease n=1 Tax=Microbacterium testaceum TaxID=2033 RepID=UPI001CD9C922|nr:MFS transporter permease [Microbacterium testaceum]